MEIPVKNQQGQEVRSIQVNDAVFDVPMNHALVHQALIMYQMNLRQGTHDTKTRAQVSGGGRKPWIQKHTGRARQGSIRSPQWRHGGVVFGPHPRDYRKAMPRRMRQLALKCALSEKARRGNLVCLESLDQVDGKTKSMAGLLARLGISGSALVVTEDSETQVVQAAHNLKGIWTLPVNLLNAHELLRRETLVMTEGAARRAEAMWTDLPGRQKAALGNGSAGESAETPPAAPEADASPATEAEAAEGSAE